MAKIADTNLLPVIRKFISEILTEAKSDYAKDFPTYKQMIRTNPIIGLVIQYIGIVGGESFGSYYHDDPKIQVSIESQFENMQGSLQLSTEELIASTYAFGCGVSNWGVIVEKGQIKLIDIAILDPQFYTFKGNYGQNRTLVYDGGNTKYELPLTGPDARLIHVLNNRGVSFRDPGGIPALERIRSVWEAWRIVISEMLVFSQRQATPILVGFSDSTVSVPLFDSNGNPLEDSEGNPVSISAPEAMLNQLSSIENRSVISTDVQNRIEAIVQNTGGEFFFHCLKYLQQLMFMGLLFPETIFAVSNDSGDSNLNKGHQFTLDIVLRSLQNQISEALLENPVRFLITQMHGEQDSYGEFRKPEEPLDIDGKVKILSSVFSGVSSAVLDAASPEVYDKVALLLDLDRKKNKKMSAFSNLYW